MRLKDKLAVVTGGASGFGMGIAKIFAREGAHVVIADIQQELADKQIADIKNNGGSAEFFHLDVTNFEQAKNLVALIEERNSSIDIWVANAGLGQRPSALEDTNDDEYMRQFDVNVKGVFYNCKAILPHFKARKAGNIIITASGIALRPRPNLVIYGATKGAVLNLAKGLAIEVAGDNIRVNALCPAVGDTPMLAEFMGGVETQEEKEKWRQALPLGRLIRPEDMGEAALYLADDKASSRVTGMTFPVDSGRTV